MPLQKSIFRVQITLFSVINIALQKRPRISAMVSKDTVVYASCEISPQKGVKGPLDHGGSSKTHYLGSMGHVFAKKGNIFQCMVQHLAKCFGWSDQCQLIL